MNNCSDYSWSYLKQEGVMKGKTKKSSAPKQKRAVATRNNIMEVAKSLFASKGYYGTNSREIATEAGLSIGSFYSYFKNKKVLLLEILKLHTEQFIIRSFVQEQLGVFDGVGKKEIIYNYINRIINAYDHSSEFHRETLVLRYSDPDVKKIYDEAKVFELNHTIAILKLFGDDLRIKNFEAAAFVVHGAIEKAAHSIQLSESKIDKEMVLNELSDMIFRYLFS